MEKKTKNSCMKCGIKGKIGKSLWQFKHWKKYYVCQKCGDELSGQHLDIICGM